MDLGKYIMFAKKITYVILQLLYNRNMPKSTTITQEIIIETAFEMVRTERFTVLSARNIAKQIG